MKYFIKQFTGMILFTLCMVVPDFVMAKSENRMDKVPIITKEALFSYEKGQVVPPKLKIKLLDGLAEGERFYLKLEGANWQKDEVIILNNETTKVTGHKLKSNELEVKVEKGSLTNDTLLEIPLEVKITGSEAKVTIDANNTTLTQETLTIAYGSDAKVKIFTQSPVNKIVNQGESTPIYLEETYGGQLRDALEQNQEGSLILAVEEKGYTLFVTEGTKITGEKGYEGLLVGKENFKVIDDQHIEIKIPDTIKTMDKSQKGTLKIEGIGIKVVGNQPKHTSIKGSLKGKVVEGQEITLGEAVDYEVALKIEPQKMLSGTTKQVGFRLDESIKGALIRERPLHISLTEGVKCVLNNKNQVEVVINDIKKTYEPLIEKGRVIGFTISQLTEEDFKNTTTFNISFPIQVPLQYSGSIGLQIEGSGLPKDLAATIGEAKVPIAVSSEHFEVKSGLKGQQGGMVTLRETQSGAIREDGEMHITMDTDYLKLEKLPAIAVTEGDIVLGEARIGEEGIIIPILKASTEPSTIVLKHFTLTLDGTAPKGRYEIGFGGTALGTSQDKIIKEDFILVEVGPKNKKIITFKLGEEAYAVNGKYYHLDVVPYLEEGRVMVPIKYVTESLGMSDEQVKFNDKSSTVTIYADKVIELKIGSDEIVVDGQVQKMQTSTQLVSGRTMVPIGEIARALELEVSWNAPLETATFISYYQ